MSKEILLNKLEKQFSYYELVDEMQETINYSKIVDFLDNEKDQKISDLEAKLVESEKSKEINIKERDKICLEMATEYNREIIQLKQQLAEKEKEIKKLKTLVDAIDKYGQYEKSSKNLVILDPERYYTDGHKLIIKPDKQDKIDYAVEQLERVKETFTWGKDNGYLTLNNAVNIIDQLITEIKEGK